MKKTVSFIQLYAYLGVKRTKKTESASAFIDALNMPRKKEARFEK